MSCPGIWEPADFEINGGDTILTKQIVTALLIQPRSSLNLNGDRSSSAIRG